MSDVDTGRGGAGRGAVPAGPDRLPAIPADVSYEVAIDPEPPSCPPVPVEPAPLVATRLDIIPAHLRTLEGVRKTAGRHGGWLAHHAGFHGIRSPWYLLAAVLWAVVGLAKVVRRQVAWWWVTEQDSLRSQAVASGDTREWMRLHKEAKDTRRLRGYALLGEALALLVAIVVLAMYGRWWVWAPLGAVAVAGLARAGRPKDRPIIRQAVVTPRFRKLSADIVQRAYYAAGLGHPDKEGQQIAFADRMREEGAGCGVLVDLPYGKTLKDAIDARAKLASGLDVTESQVFIRRDPTSTRRHKLWVAYQDPLAVPVGKTPLLAARATDIWKRAPLGLDERGQLVAVEMMWHSFLFGAMPRQGKSWSARLLALFAALDPFVQLDVFDASGKPDWRKFALVAESCAFGLTPTRDGKPPEILRDALLRLKDDVEQRYERLSSLPTSICPEGKLTREIARDPRYRMPVRVLILDEVQEYFLLGEISIDIAKLLVYLVKVAPGAGVIVLSATQRPSGIGSGQIQTQFVNFRDQHQVRFALRTPSWGVSDLVLGDGAYSAGLDSSSLLADYKGVGILRGAMDASPTTRCYYASDEDAERVLLAARALRERAGTLTGYAAGQEVERPSRDVLGDVMAVFGDDAGLHWSVLAARLRAQFPDRWEGATADSVSAECRALGVPVRQVKMFGQNLNGCRKADIGQIAGQR